jgi:multidrug efflux pump subunit AcrB
VRLGDVANVADGLENIRTGSWYNGQRAVTLAVFRQPGANTIEVVDEINQVVPRFMEQLPASVQLNVIYDRSQSIRASVEDVQWTLIIAALLVVAVIFVFLRTLSATFIPSLALPIAVIGTFAGMSFLGYSLDNLSLMALTLSVGFVVDDAIVMLENIVRHVEAGETAFDAALKGAKEIAFTILSMTVSLAAVFIPVLFMGGIVGRLLHEFAVTIILAIVISGIVSITLTPMLCSRFLKDQHQHNPGAFLKWSERSFQRLQSGYERSLAWALHHGRVIFGIFLASLMATVVLFWIMPSDFIPSSDIGMIQASTEAANGTGFPQMVKYQQKAAAILQSDPNIASSMSSVDSNNTGRFVMRLKPRSERKNSADQLIQTLRNKTGNIPGLNVFYRNPPSDQHRRPAHQFDVPVQPAGPRHERAAGRRPAS